MAKKVKDVFKRNQAKSKSMGVSRFMDEPGYAKSLINVAKKANK